MFRKLVANLSFSPSLITEVGFYAHRLRNENATRRLALIFMALALIVQSLAILSPPESANASSDQDLLRGGVMSKDDFIARYKANESNIRDIISAIGITDTELAAIKPSSIQSKENAFIAGRLPRFGTSDGEVRFSYTRSDTGQIETIYFSPLNFLATDDATRQLGTSYEGWVGQSTAAGWFAILGNSGNVVVKALPKSIQSDNPGLEQEIQALNLSQGGVNADSVTAEAGDRISYTITVRNNSSKNQLAPLAIALGDVMEYAILMDRGGALLDDKSHTLSWPPVLLAPNQTEQRTFGVQLLDPLPATAKGVSNPMSYDCVITTAYGTNSNIHLKCPAPKDVETIVGAFPTIGITGNILFALVVGTITIFFYLRTRQLKEEIRLIRHNLNEGTI